MNPEQANQTILPKIVGPLLNWYDKNARVLPWRDKPTPYRVWISEIMLQQTRVEAVKPYFDRFLAQLPNVQALANASEQQLLKLWEGLGYYNRVRNLNKAAQQILNQHQGEIPSSPQLLLKLPGIGKYSAGAIASIAFGLPVAAIDGNVLRVISRITFDASDITQEKVKQNMAQTIEKIIPTSRAGDFNQALMELGATVCLPNGAPKCEECPLCHLCMAFNQDAVDKLPSEKRKKAQKNRKKDRSYTRKSPTCRHSKAQQYWFTGFLVGISQF